MVYENAIFTIADHLADDFVAAVREAGAIFRTWPGCHSVDLLHCVEVPERFVLVIVWESIESHLAFRETEAFERWRAATGGAFREVPVDMTHYEVVATH